MIHLHFVKSELEVVYRVSETQLKVSDNSNYVTLGLNPGSIDINKRHNRLIFHRIYVGLHVLVLQAPIE